MQKLPGELMKVWWSKTGRRLKVAGCEQGLRVTLDGDEATTFMVPGVVNGQYFESLEAWLQHDLKRIASATGSGSTSSTPSTGLRTPTNRD